MRHSRQNCMRAALPAEQEHSWGGSTSNNRIGFTHSQEGCSQGRREGGGQQH
jgi:hypothetical protein